MPPTEHYNEISFKIPVTTKSFSTYIFDTDIKSLTQLQSVIAAGNAANYLKVGDFFNLYMDSVTFDSGDSIEGWPPTRAVVLGIDHNSAKEGRNRVHFFIGRSVDSESPGKDTAFCAQYMNTPASTFAGKNTGGWNSCEMKTWLNDTFYNALNNELKSVISECTKYTDNTGDGSTSAAAVTATSQKIWLMSEFEVTGTRTVANEYEQNSQAQYEYYKNGNSAKRYRPDLGSATGWWTRSPATTAGDFCNINSYGNPQARAVRFTNGLVPCFTIS